MNPRIHPTAIIEENVDIGPGTAVWDSVHIRSSARIGRECIIGEKTYIAGGVRIGHRVKINAFVYNLRRGDDRGRGDGQRGDDFHQ